MPMFSMLYVITLLGAVCMLCLGGEMWSKQKGQSAFDYINKAEFSAKFMVVGGIMLAVLSCICMVSTTENYYNKIAYEAKVEDLISQNEELRVRMNNSNEHANKMEKQVADYRYQLNALGVNAEKRLSNAELKRQFDARIESNIKFNRLLMDFFNKAAATDLSLDQK